MKMRGPYGFALITVAAGIASAFYFFEHGHVRDIFGLTSSPAALSKIGIIEGQVRLRKNNEMGSEPLEEKRPLFSGDRVETSAQSSVDLEIGTGGLLKVLENSRVLLERDEKSIPPLIRVEVIEGQVQTVVKPAETNIVLVEGGVATSLAEHARMPIQKIDETPGDPGNAQSVTSPPSGKTGIEKQPIAATPPQTAPTGDTLPDDYIESTVRNQKSLLSRCFADHLKANTKSQGRVDLSFMIEPSGTVQQVRVIGSTINDDKFKNCLVQVIERVQFRKFKSEPILVNYPLSFE